MTKRSAILAGLAVATLAMFVLGWKAIRLFIYVLQQDRSWLFPFVLVLVTLGAFATTNTFFPVWIAIIFGIVGLVFESRGFPVVTIVLGIILGPVIEVNLRLALALSNGQWSTFIATWPRVALLILVILLLAYELYQAAKSGARQKAMPSESQP